MKKENKELYSTLLEYKFFRRTEECIWRYFSLIRYVRLCLKFQCQRIFKKLPLVDSFIFAYIGEIGIVFSIFGLLTRNTFDLKILFISEVHEPEPKTDTEFKPKRLSHLGSSN